MKKFRELREDWRIGKLEKEIFQQEAPSAGSDGGDNLKMEAEGRKWTNKQAAYYKKRREMLDYDSFQEFVSSVSSGQPRQQRLDPGLAYRQELLKRLEIEFNFAPMKILEQIFQRLTENLAKDEQRHKFFTSPIKLYPKYCKRIFCYLY